MKRIPIRGHVAIFLSCIVFASNIVVSNELMDGWMTPLGYTLTRLLYGAVAFWLIGLFRARERVGRKDLFVLGFGGVLGFIVSQLAFATSLRFTTPVNFSLIMAMSPVLILVLSAIFLKERVGLLKIVGIGLSVAGAVLIIMQRATGTADAPNNALGVFMAFVSMSSYAVYLMITREVTQRYSAVTIMKWMFLFTAIGFLPIGLADLVQQPIFSADTAAVPIAQLAFVLIFDATLVFFLLLYALSALRTTTVSTYLNLLPVFTAVVATAQGQEAFTAYKILATVLVIGGVFMVTRASDVAPVPTDESVVGA